VAIDGKLLGIEKLRDLRTKIEGDRPKEGTVHALVKRPARVTLLSLFLGILAGCNTIDLPRPLQVNRWFTREDPLVVLRDSTDGYKRGEALAQLREPVQHGGTAEEQELYIKILTTAARKDGEPLCRLRAISTLGKYKDPRAVQCLEEICQQSPPFTPDMNSLIRQTALASLQETGDPAARKMLLVVARGAESPLESSLTDRQQTLDERLAAIRGLGKFKQYDSIETLVHILETERDAALRECAHRSLREATGKNLAAEPALWRDMLRDPNALEGREPNFIERVVGVRKD
jgi:hypothetical protein